MTDAPTCPETGKPMVRDTRPMTLTYKGQSTTIDMPGWYCNESGESIHTGEDMKVSDAALKALKIKVENLLTPDEVRRIRLKMGLTQRQAGALIGAGQMRSRNMRRAMSRSARELAISFACWSATPKKLKSSKNKPEIGSRYRKRQPPFSFAAKI